MPDLRLGRIGSQQGSLMTGEKQTYYCLKEVVSRQDSVQTVGGGCCSMGNYSLSVSGQAARSTQHAESGLIMAAG